MSSSRREYHDHDHEDSASCDRNPRKLYIGNLPSDSTEEEIRREFRRFGRIASVESKGKFAFVEYEREPDTEEALHAMDGRRFLGERIQVQRHNPALRSARGPPSYQVVPPPPRSLGPRPTGRERRTDYRVLIFNLDDRVSWQDLKDFGRNAGDVNFANVFTRDGCKIGVIEYFDFRTMERALERLHRLRLYDKRVVVEEDRGQLDGSNSSGGHGHGGGGGGAMHYSGPGNSSAPEVSGQYHGGSSGSVGVPLSPVGGHYSQSGGDRKRRLEPQRSRSRSREGYYAPRGHGTPTGGISQRNPAEYDEMVIPPRYGGSARRGSFRMGEGSGNGVARGDGGRRRGSGGDVRDVHPMSSNHNNLMGDPMVSAGNRDDMDSWNNAGVESGMYNANGHAAGHAGSAHRHRGAGSVEDGRMMMAGGGGFRGQSGRSLSPMADDRRRPPPHRQGNMVPRGGGESPFRGGRIRGNGGGRDRKQLSGDEMGSGLGPVRRDKEGYGSSNGVGLGSLSPRHHSSGEVPQSDLYGGNGEPNKNPSDPQNTIHRGGPVAGGLVLEELSD